MMLAIFGPTATGKTSLAIKLAKKYNGEIISADSRQVYKGLDIGTGKISSDLQQKKIIKGKDYWQIEGIKICGFDIKNPGESFTVNDFINFANKKIAEIKKAEKLPIIAGGTGFYISTLISSPETLGIKPNVKLRKNLEKLNAKALYQLLFKLNQNKALSLNQSDKNNPRRLIRAIEVSKSKKIAGGKQPISNILLIGLTGPNQYLYKKADDWLNFRINHGMLKEVKKLIKKKISTKWLLNLGLEYRWLTKSILGDLSQKDATERLRGDTHKLIRHQKTYFNKFPHIKIFDISDTKHKSDLEKEVNQWYINQKSN